MNMPVVSKRGIAGYLLVVAAAVFLNLILTPVYHDGSTDYAVWEIMNYFMVVGVPAMLILSFQDWKSMDHSSDDSVRRVATSVVWYLAVVLAMLFFWEWFWSLNPDSETGDAVTSHIIYYPFVDALYVVVSIAVGRRLLTSNG